MTDRTVPETDWRRQIPEARRRPLRLWLWAVAATTLGVLIVGGITRLTQSGLSIVDWDPIVGAVPPLDEPAWAEAFDRYKQFPEYQKLRRGMTLEEFRLIYFWEYLHRLLARAIGIVFLIPFLYFAARRYFNRPLAVRALALFGLGAAQGVMGWLMVASGLVDRPSVSHLRLAAHLSLAFLIFGYAVWLARELAVGDTPTRIDPGARRGLVRGLAAVGLVLALQIVWGAFTAGLDAGYVHNTFPLMQGRLVPPNLLWLDPAISNFVHNPVAVQWTHRVLGTVLAVAAIALSLDLRRRPIDLRSRRLHVGFLALILGQYLLGVLTLIYRVPISLAVFHQAAAMVIFGYWTAWVHHALGLSPAGETERAAVTAPR